MVGLTVNFGGFGEHDQTIVAGFVGPVKVKEPLLPLQSPFGITIFTGSPCCGGSVPFAGLKVTPVKLLLADQFRPL